MACPVPTVAVLLCLCIVVHGDDESNMSLQKRIELLERQGMIMFERLERQEKMLMFQAGVIHTQDENLNRHALVIQSHEENLKAQAYVIQDQEEKLKANAQVIQRHAEKLTAMSLHIEKQEVLLQQQARQTQTLRSVIRDMDIKMQKLERTTNKLSLELLLSRNTNSQHKQRANTSNSHDIQLQPGSHVASSNLTVGFMTKFSAGHFKSQYRGRRGSPSSSDGKRIISVNDEPVAFHAVIGVHEVPNLGINQNIVFDVVHENLGGSYHNQHGVFVAPKDGVYIFSASLLSSTNQHPLFGADLKKDGVVLARIYGHAADNGYYDQGSVTVVTKLSVGNEVWVSLNWPGGDTIYGESYTSFTGCLIMAL